MKLTEKQINNMREVAKMINDILVRPDYGNDAEWTAFWESYEALEDHLGTNPSDVADYLNEFADFFSK